MLKDLHSTLIKYKEPIVINKDYTVIAFTFHSD